MDAVVFDLELVKRFRKGQPSEIVEIGACRVDLAARSVTRQFQIYVMPQSGHIPKSTRTFIGISKSALESAVPFAEAIRRFADWIGGGCYLCSWGSDDRFHLIDECVRKNVPLDWFNNYNDVQRQIGAVLRPGVKEQLGLRQALELAGIEPVGKTHRGIDDALNTANLLIRYADRLQFMSNSVSEEEIRQKLSRLSQNQSAPRKRFAFAGRREPDKRQEPSSRQAEGRRIFSRPEPR